MNRGPSCFHLIIEKSRADLVSEARRGYLGMLWWVIEPMLYLLVFYVVFVLVFSRGGEDAVAFLLVGLVVWRWFAVSIPQCSNSILANGRLIQQVYLPKWVLPLMSLLTATYKFLFVVLLLLLFLVVSGFPPSQHWLALLPLIGSQFLLICALGLVLASILPFLPDLKLVVENGMTLLFFLSGIFFDVSTAPSGLRDLLYLNPMLGLIEGYRKVLLEASWPDWRYLSGIVLVSFVLLGVGIHLLKKYDRVYPKIV